MKNRVGKKGQGATERKVAPRTEAVRPDNCWNSDALHTLCNGGEITE